MSKRPLACSGPSDVQLEADPGDAVEFQGRGRRRPEAAAHAHRTVERHRVVGADAAAQAAVDVGAEGAVEAVGVQDAVLAEGAAGAERPAEGYLRQVAGADAARVGVHAERRAAVRAGGRLAGEADRRDAEAGAAAEGAGALVAAAPAVGVVGQRVDAGLPAGDRAVGAGGRRAAEAVGADLARAASDAAAAAVRWVVQRDHADAVAVLGVQAADRVPAGAAEAAVATAVGVRAAVVRAAVFVRRRLAASRRPRAEDRERDGDAALHVSRPFARCASGTSRRPSCPRTCRPRRPRSPRESTVSGAPCTTRPS